MSKMLCKGMLAVSRLKADRNSIVSPLLTGVCLGALSEL